MQARLGRGGMAAGGPGALKSLGLLVLMFGAMQWRRFKWNRAALWMIFAVWFMRMGQQARKRWTLAFGVVMLAMDRLYAKKLAGESAEKAQSKRRLINKHRRKTGTMPPPFPNTWYWVCNSDDVHVGKVIPMSVFGREIAIFRGEDGNVGVLDAFCPHLGTHLGYGGVVKDNCLTCPYHSWKFNANGKCEEIPYCTTTIEKYSQIDSKAYEVREILGMVYVWYDVDWKPPAFELDALNHMQDWTLVRESGKYTWDMHIQEPAQNSADYYHFLTTHYSFPYSGGLVNCIHKTESEYPKEEGRRHVVTLTEHVVDFKVLGMSIPAWVREPLQPKPSVTFFGPSILLFNITYDNYKVVTVMNYTPVEDLKQLTVAKTFIGDTSIPHVLKPLGLFFHNMACGTVEQDRQVWEHKAHCKPMRLVRGDGQFVQFSNWLQQFYSKNSEKIDLTW
uniref:cholesterol 7-desaturase n=1 Tax=Mucochytrium quahogii TaxID=96639 RepID=A0A7S2S0M4_9STRA|mmetsp:Transcript_10606/g.17311  ORF Transcript_10606/g.17311 Transcript_10606/m.17311 type:complete len:447 (+) Transcript_10606:812-2152(+)